MGLNLTKILARPTRTRGIGMPATPTLQAVRARRWPDAHPRWGERPEEPVAQPLLVIQLPSWPTVAVTVERVPSDPTPLHVYWVWFIGMH